ncbi:flagellar hook-length control protein FliK [bacterium]|nr:flagellar hook-length control protein FliK [bacterium]
MINVGPDFSLPGFASKKPSPMISLGSDFLLPGLASKKPNPVASPRDHGLPETAPDDTSFAEELDAVAADSHTEKEFDADAEPESIAIRETASADSSQLLSSLATYNGSGQTPGLIPATTANTPQVLNPTVFASNLTIDSQGLGTTDTDGDMNANLQNSNKSILLATASLASDTKPLDTAGARTFSSTLSAAANDAANQTARTAAQSAARRSARPAQNTPATAQVAVHIVRAVADGISRFNVQLRPAELGRVEVKLEISRDGAVRAMVIADRQETVDQLQRDSRALERALQDAGLKADSQNLQFSLRGGQNGHALSENRTPISKSGDADPEKISESAPAGHWSNVAGSTGALDIKV